MANDDEKRGGFLNLFGPQGLGTGAVRPTPVFGSDEASNLIADPRLTVGHYVVYPKRLLRKATEEEQHEWQRTHALAAEALGARVVGKITKNRDPQNAITTRQGHIVVPPVLGEERTVMSGQAAFYVASTELREQFAAFSRDTLSLSDLDLTLRSMATLVTIVDAAIHARPAGMGLGAREYERMDELGGRGFDVVASFRQFVVIGMPKKEIAEFTLYSEHGEYPVEVPRDVEMGYLLRADKEVIASPPGITRDMSPKERAARLAEKLKAL